MNVSYQKRLAAEVAGVGVSRIWIDPEKLSVVQSAVTREDIKKLMRDGVIRVKPVKGVSRVRARERAQKRKKGLRKGPGSRKGSLARVYRRVRLNNVRAQRKFIKMLRAKKLISRRVYRELYLKIKGGAFSSTRHIRTYLEEHDLIKR